MNSETDHRMSGLYAALITPVDERGHPQTNDLRRLLDFVLEGGVDGVCLGGGTAEYPHFSLEQRKLIIETASRHLNGSAPFIAAIGAPTIRGVLELGRHALENGSSRLLLPMPYFFRYDQADLAAYAREVAQTLDAPCLLYNLSAFTNPILPDTTLELLRKEPNIIGLKDSSGDRKALRRLAEDRSPADTLLCGNDAVLLEALGLGWDGAISGIASCAPEVLTSVYRSHRAGDIEEARRSMALLNELVVLVGRLPFPWSIRIACEARGLPNGPLPWPLSPEREAEARRLRDEFERWFEKHLPLIRTFDKPVKT